MKWLVRIAAILLGLAALLVVGLVALVFIDGAFGKKAQDLSNITYPAADGTPLYAYVARPSTLGPHPAVIMVHEFYGLTDSIVKQADALAQEGYVVLAPDTYRNQTTSLIPRAIYLRVTVSEERVMQDLQTAFDYLASQTDVDAGRIAVLGFCYGGEMALQHALRNANLAATVVLYGSPVVDADGLGALLDTKTPILGIFAENDQQITPSDAAAFDTALTAAEIPHTVTVYPGVGHAFVQPETIAADGAARQAWEQILEFLNTNLKNKPSSFVPRGAPLAVGTGDFRVHSLSHANKFDLAYLCTVALSHLGSH